jgi:hypothetical protein
MTRLDSFGFAMLAAATFFILHSIIDVQVRILIVSNEINTKEKKIAHLWPKRVEMTRLGSFCLPLPPFSYAQDVPCRYRCCPVSSYCPVSQLYGVRVCETQWVVVVVLSLLCLPVVGHVVIEPGANLNRTFWTWTFCSCSGSQGAWTEPGGAGSGSGTWPPNPHLTEPRPVY